MPALRRPRTLAVRSDSIGDVLLAEPALRAIAATSDLTLLCSPHGRPAVDVLAAAPRTLVFDTPWVGVVGALLDAGHRVMVTGHADETAAHEVVAAAPDAVSLVGRTSLRDLVPVLAQATAVCVGNTGILHLAAAVGTPVVALFPPTVPVSRCRPWSVPHVVLGVHDFDCAPCCLRRCPYGNHPCCDVPASEVVEAVATIGRAASGPRAGVGVAS
jgi:ADP-heptose:LPS heptosyltransferase